MMLLKHGKLIPYYFIKNFSLLQRTSNSPKNLSKSQNLLDFRFGSECE